MILSFNANSNGSNMRLFFFYLRALRSLKCTCIQDKNVKATNRVTIVI